MDGIDAGTDDTFPLYLDDFTEEEKEILDQHLKSAYAVHREERLAAVRSMMSFGYDSYPLQCSRQILNVYSGMAFTVLFRCDAP